MAETTIFEHVENNAAKELRGSASFLEPVPSRRWPRAQTLCTLTFRAISCEWDAGGIKGGSGPYLLEWCHRRLDHRLGGVDDHRQPLHHRPNRGSLADDLRGRHRTLLELHRKQQGNHLCRVCGIGFFRTVHVLAGTGDLRHTRRSTNCCSLELRTSSGGQGIGTANNCPGNNLWEQAWQ
jgi:hypothetical protein